MTEESFSIGKRRTDGDIPLTAMEYFERIERDLKDKIDSVQSLFLWLFGGTAIVALAVLIGIWNAWGDYRDWQGASEIGAQGILDRVEDNRQDIRVLEERFVYHQRNHPPAMRLGLQDTGKDPLQ